MSWNKTNHTFSRASCACLKWRNILWFLGFSKMNNSYKCWHAQESHRTPTEKGGVGLNAASCCPMFDVFARGHVCLGRNWRGWPRFKMWSGKKEKMSVSFSDTKKCYVIVITFSNSLSLSILVSWPSPSVLLSSNVLSGNCAARGRYSRRRGRRLPSWARVLQRTEEILKQRREVSQQQLVMHLTNPLSQQGSYPPYLLSSIPHKPSYSATRALSILPMFM